MCRTAALLLLTLFAVAEDLDASASWNPRYAIGVLAGLRAPLDAAPDDQHLLGQALQAYVDLCFSGDPDLTGQLGPWLGYAEQIAAKRRQLRGGHAPASFAEAAPELWLTLAQGDTAAVVTGLAAWPAAAVDPQARALRAAATRDVGPFLTAPPVTALEWYGYLTACVGSKVEPRLLIGHLPTGVDPVVVISGRNESGSSYEEATAVRTIFADVAWMLNSAQAPDVEATAQLTALTTALGGDAPSPGTDRAGLVRAAMTAAKTYDCRSAAPFIVAWKACVALRGGAGGIRGADGKHLLVGIGDVAAWNLARLYVAGYMQPVASQLGERYPEVVGEPMNAALPGTLLAARSRIGWSAATPEVARQLAEAMRREFAGQGELPIAIACTSAERVANVLKGAAADLLRLAIATAQPADGSGRQRSLHRLRLASEIAGTLSDLLPAATRQLARDPYNQDLWRLVRLGSEPLLGALDGVTPTLERSEPQVDLAQMPPAGTDFTEFVAGRWNGLLLVNAAGPMEIAIESDDQSQLVVDQAVLINPGVHGMVRTSAVVTLSAGWHPLRLEWCNLWGGGGIRLLWRQGGGDFVPVPADHLAHGADHAPGLTAAYWNIGRKLNALIYQPTPADVARAAQMPWLWPAQCDVGMAFADAGQWSQALPYLTAAIGHSRVDLQVRRMQLWAFAKQSDDELAKPGRAEALVEAFRSTSCLDNKFGLATAIATGLGKAHAEDLMGRIFHADFTACCVASWPVGRMALARGDWAQAVRQGEALIAHDGQNGGQRWAHDLLQIEKVILRRIDGVEPDWTELRESAMDNQGTPYIRLFTRWFTGLATWDEVLAKVPTTTDGDAVRWLRGLYDVSVGDLAGAQQVLPPMIATHPDWIESNDAAGLLRWCAKQTPTTIAALKHAKLLEQTARPVPETVHF